MPGADPLEARDLAAEDPERAAALHKELRAWREAVGAPVPAEPEPSYAGADGGS